MSSHTLAMAPVGASPPYLTGSEGEERMTTMKDRYN